MLLSRRNALAWLASFGASEGFSKTNKKVDPAPVKPEKKAFVIAITNRYALIYLPLMVAERMGYFAQMGLELEISEQQSMVRAQQAVLLGAADAVCGWVENVLALQAKKQFFQSFVLMGSSPNVVLGVSSKVSDVNRIAQLKDHKIGVLSLGSPMHTVAHALLRRAGLSDSQMRFVSVGSASSALAALRAGQIDALAYMDPLITQLEQRGEIKILADTRAPYAAQQALGLSLPSSCLYASPELFLRLPVTAQSACDAMVLALRWLNQASLLDIVKLLPEAAIGDDRRAFIGSVERMRESFSLTGQLPQKAAQDLLRAMQAADTTVQTEDVDVERAYTNALVQRSARL